MVKQITITLNSPGSAIETLPTRNNAILISHTVIVLPMWSYLSLFPMILPQNKMVKLLSLGSEICICKQLSCRYILFITSIQGTRNLGGSQQMKTT